MPAATAGSCAVDSDCTASTRLRPLAGIEGCYCPVCPVPVPAPSAERWRVGWEAVCGGTRALEADCREVDRKRPPGPPGCRQERRVWIAAGDRL